MPADQGTPEDATTAVLIHPHDSVEADTMRLFLEEQGIDVNVVSFRDAAYPGVVDRERPWGELRVREQDLARAKQALHQWAQAEAVEDPGADQRPQEPPPRLSWSPTKLVIGAVFLLGLAALLWASVPAHTRRALWDDLWGSGAAPE